MTNDCLMNPEQQLQRIQQKLQQLLQQHQHVQKENQRLQKDNDKLLAQVALQEAQIQQIQQRSDVNQLQGSNLNPTAKAALEKRINMYLKDIDRCLALLNA